MERAVKLWEELQFPRLNIKSRWYGYSRGNWTEEEEQEVELAVKGRHDETREKLGNRR